MWLIRGATEGVEPLAGLGPDADTVSLSVLAEDTAAWWQLEVFSDESELLLLEHLAAGTDADTLTWDGRGGDGLIVDNGDYLLKVVALDDAWNAGAACSRSSWSDSNETRWRCSGFSQRTSSLWKS